MCQSGVSGFSHTPGAVPNSKSFSDVKTLPMLACTGSGLNIAQCSVNSDTCNIYSGVVCQGMPMLLMLLMHVV